jgi:LAGLIDADG DNA endonuclease family protein
VTGAGSPKPLSPKKAALHGMICSDGHFNMFSMNKGKRHASYRIVLAEPNTEIRRLFKRFVWRVYHVRARDKPERGVIIAFGANMMRDMSQYGPFEKMNWVAPLLYLDRRAARAWARSYFDGDGDVRLTSIVSKCKVRAKSVNLRGLESVKTLLWSFFGIQCKIYRRERPAHDNWSQAFELQIFNRKNLMKYARLVGFNHPAKQRKLRRIVELIKRSRS